MKAVLTPGQFVKVLLVWGAIAGGIFVLSLCVSGRIDARGIQWGWPDGDTLRLRLPSVLAAAIIGFALAASGVALQALLRNPLADPYLLGISSGSTVGVMAWMLACELLLPQASDTTAYVFLLMGRSVPAVVGAVLTCLLVFALARGRWSGGGMQPVTLLLVGVVVSSINGALLMVLNSLAPHGLRADLATFLLGSISDGDLSTPLLWTAAVALACGYLPVLLSAAALNVGTLSDTEATSLGVQVQRLRVVSFVCASIMTGAAILLSGPIGFVGLICPHICRRLKWIGGPDHRTLLISAPLCGAAFLMLANTAVRVGVTLKMGQFPVGVVTALCGGPFFLFLLRRAAKQELPVMAVEPQMPLRVATLAAEGLRFAYGDRPVIEGLSLSLRAGELAAIVGPNGCGKSTLLNLLAGALAPQAGTVSIDGKSLDDLGRIGAARRMALVPQMGGAGTDAVLGGAGFSVEQSVLMARYAAHVDDSPGLLRTFGGLGVLGFESREDEKLAREAMWDADVHHLAEREVETLSGGERQRVAIARALAQQTPILLLDEPTTALDLFHELELLAQLRAMAAAGRIVLLVTHDLNLAAEIASRVLVMDQGRVIADGTPARVLTPAVLEPVYHVQVRQEGGALHFARREPR